MINAPQELSIGSRAPDWSLPDINGNHYSLAQSLGTHGALLTFVRGMFCPYCTEQLHQLWAGEAAIFERGVHPLVIATHGREALAVAAALAYTRMSILIDKNCLVMDSYNIPLDLSQPSMSDMRQPTTVLLDANQTVRWMYVGTSFSDRPKLADVLHHIDRMLADALQTEPTQ